MDVQLRQSHVEFPVEQRFRGHVIFFQSLFDGAGIGIEAAGDFIDVRLLVVFLASDAEVVGAKQIKGLNSCYRLPARLLRGGGFLRAITGRCSLFSGALIAMRSISITSTRSVVSVVSVVTVFTTPGFWFCFVARGVVLVARVIPFITVWFLIAAGAANMGSNGCGVFQPGLRSLMVAGSGIRGAFAVGASIAITTATAIGISSSFGATRAVAVPVRTSGGLG